MSLSLWLKSLLRRRVDLRERFEFIRPPSLDGSLAIFSVSERATRRSLLLKLYPKSDGKRVRPRFARPAWPIDVAIGRKLIHPRVARTVECGINSDGESFVVLEAAEGKLLDAALFGRGDGLQGKQLKLLRDAAQAIEYVHQRGYVLRNLRPRMFALGRGYDSLKLVDWQGIARGSAADDGVLVGSDAHDYAAPEYFDGRPRDRLADVFSFGAVAFELCTKQLPWRRTPTAEDARLARGQVSSTDIRSIKSRLHPTLAEAITGCLNTLPEKRTASIKQFLNQIATLNAAEI